MTLKERSQYIIDVLELEPHPEGGFYREIYRNDELVTRENNQSRSAGTAIYFLLPEGICTDWHRLEVDELWHFYEGNELILEIINTEGKFQQLKLCDSLAKEDRYQQLVPKNCWQRAYSTGSYSLVGCTVTPGFEFEDFEKVSSSSLAEQYPNFASEIKRDPFDD